MAGQDVSAFPKLPSTESMTEFSEVVKHNLRISGSRTGFTSPRACLISRLLTENLNFSVFGTASRKWGTVSQSPRDQQNISELEIQVGLVFRNSDCGRLNALQGVNGGGRIVARGNRLKPILTQLRPVFHRWPPQ